MPTTVAVRMYNVGFGDAFLVTITRGGRAWRMLVDCGVHNQGRARPIADTVDAIIADLTAASSDGTPRLDVVVATHHHADHIVGFSLPAWEQVTVDEVWVPFVEDVTDPDALALRQAQADAARRLLALARQRIALAGDGAPSAAASSAFEFALNSSGNAEATDRLLGRNGKGFAAPHRVRYLPGRDPGAIHPAPGVTVHVLGPPRDPDHLRRMEPPAGAGWLLLDTDPAPADAEVRPLFDPAYVVTDMSHVPPEALDALPSLDLGSVDNDQGLLGAAAILERAVNNTSVFLVVDVDGTRLVFPGDAQQGAWDHVLDDPSARALVEDAAFYKIGHHGSGNATPPRFVEALQGSGWAMLPWRLVERWKDSIPKASLLDALAAHDRRVVRADAPRAEPGVVTVHGDLWSELTLTVA